MKETLVLSQVMNVEERQQHRVVVTLVAEMDRLVEMENVIQSKQ